jgi:hypothetical protein
MTQLTGGGRTIFLIVMGFELGQTRKRSDTVSTHSDSHDQKRSRLGDIQ